MMWKLIRNPIAEEQIILCGYCSNQAQPQDHWTGVKSRLFDKANTAILVSIQLLEYPIPPSSSSSQKPTPGDISGTKRAIIDPLVSKQPEKMLKQICKKIPKISKCQHPISVLTLKFWGWLGFSKRTPYCRLSFCFKDDHDGWAGNLRKFDYV